MTASLGARSRPHGGEIGGTWVRGTLLTWIRFHHALALGCFRSGYRHSALWLWHHASVTKSHANYRLPEGHAEPDDPEVWRQGVLGLTSRDSAPSVIRLWTEDALGLISSVSPSEASASTLAELLVSAETCIVASEAATRSQPISGSIAEAQTSSRLLPQAIEREIELEFACAEDETFEDGIESALSNAIEAWIAEWDTLAMDVLAHRIAYGRTGPNVAAEALKCLGRLKHARTREWRRWMLERSLGATSAVVRDAAVVGLASFYDVRSAVALLGAAERERLPELKREMLRVANYLRAR